jgi:hypothetical protein
MAPHKRINIPIPIIIIALTVQPGSCPLVIGCRSVGAVTIAQSLVPPNIYPSVCPFLLPGMSLPMDDLHVSTGASPLLHRNVFLHRHRKFNNYVGAAAFIDVYVL